MALIDRVKNILLTPKTEWPVIAAEPATAQGLFTGYAAILALLPMAGALIAGLLLAGMMPRLAMYGANGTILIAVVSYVLGLALLYLIALIVNAIVPSFDGTASLVQTLKLLIYASTPVWIVGFFAALIPIVGMLLSLAAVAYAIYLIYLGCGPVLNIPDAKSVGFTAVTVVIYLIVSWVVMAVVIGAIVATFLSSAMMLGAAYGV